MPRHDRPLVSVGLPVRNGEQYVAEAVSSQLAQTLNDIELVVSDNASTDGTEEICRSLAARDRRLRYFRNEVDLGAAPNFRRVFELSAGRYFKWAGHDDACEPRYLERCVQRLEEHPDAVLAHTVTRSVDAAGKRLYDWRGDARMASERAAERFDGALRLRETFYVWGVARREAMSRTRLLGSYVGHDRPYLSSLALQGRFLMVDPALPLL
jgi:glycosyltransferase involved in cell wall biosynthesis